MKKKFDLTISIVSYNTKELLKKCLRSIYKNTKELECEIYVVDNASLDGSCNMTKKFFPKVHLISNKQNLGYASANNQAIKRAKGEYILLLNPDTRVMEGALISMIEFMKNNTKIGAIGPKLIDENRKLQSSWARFPSIFSEIFKFKSQRIKSYVKPFETDWVSGGALLFRKLIVKKVGFMNEDYFMYSEETDWCYRIKKAGWKIFYYPNAEIMHSGGQSSKLDYGELINKKEINPEMYSRLFKSKFLFFYENYSYIYYLLFRSMITFGAFIKLLIHKNNIYLLLLRTAISPELKLNQPTLITPKKHLYDLTVILVSWNTKYILKECLLSFFNTCDNLKYEVFVVDNASSDGTVNMLKKEFPQVNLIANKQNFGFAKANNQALKKAKGKYILLLNPDTLVVDGTVQGMMDYLEKNYVFAACGPRILDKLEGFKDSFWLSFPSYWSEFLNQFYLSKLNFSKLVLGKATVPIEVSHLLGACIMFRKDALDQVGYLNEKYFMFLEETELCYNLIKNNWKISYLPYLKLIHFGEESVKKKPQNIVPLYYQNLCRFYRKNYKKKNLLLLKLICFSGITIRTLLWSFRWLKKQETSSDQIQTYAALMSKIWTY